MKKLRLKALYLMSHTERKAKQIIFHPQVTVIKGANDTGKSSVIKSIYWCLGAEPAVISPKWKAVNAVGLLEFTIDKAEYSILRIGSHFAVFDREGKLLLKTTSVTKDLTSFLAPLLDFGLYLTSQAGNPEIPPPAYCFIPFYVDQDAGWQGQWKSFKHLSQYPNWKQSVIPYHSGIKPNEYFVVSSELTQEKMKKGELEGELRSLMAALERLRARKRFSAIDIDQQAYKKAIAALLNELTNLQNRRLAASARMADISNQKILLDEQIGIARNALAEFDKDYKFIKDQDSPTVLCPTCGTEHENSFFHRFSLIEDREACRAFLLSATQKAAKLSSELAKANNSLGHEDFRIAKINALLEQKKAKLKFRDVIDVEGEKKAQSIMAAEVQKIYDEVREHNIAIDRLEKRLSVFNDPERRKETQRFYQAKMNTFAHAVNLISQYPEHIDHVINESGNDRPRALLAYFYAYLHTVAEYSTSCFCPIVIDSPKQQDPDEDNVVAAFNLIFSQRPSDAQLILGTVSLPDIPHGGKEITLTEKYHLLQESEYDLVSAIITPKLDTLYS